MEKVNVGNHLWDLVGSIAVRQVRAACTREQQFWLTVQLDVKEKVCRGSADRLEF